MLAVQLDDPEKTRCALLDVRSSSPSWQPMASPESPKRYHAVVAVGEYSVVMLGGWGTHVQTKTALLYDARADRWSMQEARLPQAMRCRGAPIAAGSAMLAVQLDDPEKTRCALLDVRSSSSSWQPMAFPERSKHFSAVTAVGEHSVVIRW